MLSRYRRGSGRPIEPLDCGWVRRNPAPAKRAASSAPAIHTATGRTRSRRFSSTDRPKYTDPGAPSKARARSASTVPTITTMSATRSSCTRRQSGTRRVCAARSSLISRSIDRRPVRYSARPVAANPPRLPRSAEVTRLEPLARSNVARPRIEPATLYPRANPTNAPSPVRMVVLSASIRRRWRRLAPRIRNVACSRRWASANTAPAYAANMAASTPPGTPRKMNNRLATWASPAATSSVLEMLLRR